MEVKRSAFLKTPITLFSDYTKIVFYLNRKSFLSYSESFVPSVGTYVSSVGTYISSAGTYVSSVGT